MIPVGTLKPEAIDVVHIRLSWTFFPRGLDDVCNFIDILNHTSWNIFCARLELSESVKVLRWIKESRHPNSWDLGVAFEKILPELDLLHKLNYEVSEGDIRSLE